VLISTAVISATTGVAGHELMESPVRLASPVLPLTGLAAWVGLNVFFQLSYKRLYRYRTFLYGQILVDLLVPIPFLYLSGGIFSYGWLEYPLIILEAALILPRRSDPWLVAVVSCFSAVGFALVLGAGWIRSDPSILSAAVGRDGPSIIDRLPWTVGVMLISAFFGTYLMDNVRERERELRHLANRDSLTGLYNHGRFIRQLRSEVERARRYSGTLSVLMIDMDGFKQLNDSLGHLEGDRALRATAQILRDNIRRSDTEPTYQIDIPFRYGGDEFAIIAPGIQDQSTPTVGVGSSTPSSADGAIALAERLRAVVAQAVEQEGLTASIGVASYPANGEVWDDLVSAADSALYGAKRKGGNCVVVAETLKGSQDGERGTWVRGHLE
jgi:diguanylate cyclase (GGDEF)-like protein